MNKQGILLVVISVIIFSSAVGTALNSFGIVGSRNKSISTMRSRFDGVDKEGKEKFFTIRRDTKLKLKITSHVKHGSFTFLLISPDNKVVYEKTGKLVSDINSIPVKKGRWKFRIKSNNAEDGSYFVRVVYRD